MTHRDPNGYEERVGRVVHYLIDHLDEELSLSQLARVAAFSAYHFHRVYRGLYGETPQHTVRRLRLYRAALDLLDRDLPIVRVATRAGFGSQAAFTRAFSAEFGSPPERYRLAQERRARAIADALPLAQERSPAMTIPALKSLYSVELVSLPKIRLAGLTHHGNYQLIGATFERLTVKVAPLGLFATGKMYGLYYSDPHSVPDAELRSVAAISLPSNAEVPEGLEASFIDGGQYARVLHKGPYPELEHAYDYLYEVWLPKSGFEPLDHPCVEEYLNGPREVPAKDLETAIYLPLSAR